MFDAATVWADLKAVRATNPLVHNITNYVVPNTTANALLAVGASPAMTHYVLEMEAMLAISSALVINMGTLTQEYVDAIPVAWEVANRNKVPVVLDPVAVGAIPSRTSQALGWLDKFETAIVRGNASEIMSLAGEGGGPKGVDSAHGADEARDAARFLAQKYNCVICVSGVKDMVTDGKVFWHVANGHELMPLVTGLGCTATALCGAFAPVCESNLRATVSAMAIMGIAAEMAAEKAEGPGTLQLYLYDALYQVGEKDIAQRLRVEQG